jgi:hypothetical protein
VTPPSTLFVCLNAVAVGASNLTLGYFSFNSSPGEAFTHHPGNITRFFPSHVVELKNTDISLTTIDARVAA